MARYNNYRRRGYRRFGGFRRSFRRFRTRYRTIFRTRYRTRYRTMRSPVRRRSYGPRRSRGNNLVQLIIRLATIALLIFGGIFVWNKYLRKMFKK